MIETVALADLKAHPRNYRSHPPAQIAHLAESIRANGVYRNVVAARDLTLLAGHGVVEAAATLGLATIPVTVLPLDPLSPPALKILAGDNLVTVLAVDDDPAVAALLRQIAAEDETGLLGTGYDDEALADLLASLGVAPTVGLTDPDDVPNPPQEAVTRSGDVWVLGRHRLMCGDATVATDVETLTNGAAFDLLMTDPPYGIEAPQMTLGKGKKQFHRGEWDGNRIDIAAFVGLARYSCIWGGNYYSDILPVTNDWLAWHKKNDDRSYSEFELAWTDYGCNTRMISHHWSGEVKQHPTQKPVEVVQWAIEKAPGNRTVLDLFGGSGSTLIGCEQTGRRCAMMEIDPLYCDVIVTRWQDFTGQTAVLATVHAEAAD